MVGTTPKNSFIDSGLISGHTYYYKVERIEPGGSVGLQRRGQRPRPSRRSPRATGTRRSSSPTRSTWPGTTIPTTKTGTGSSAVWARPACSRCWSSCRPTPKLRRQHGPAQHAGGLPHPGVQRGRVFRLHGRQHGHAHRSRRSASPRTPGTTQLTISWAKVNGATGYNIYRSTHAGRRRGHATLRPSRAPASSIPG